MERGFERALWDSRLAVLVAVVGCILASFGAFYMATVDAAYVLLGLVRYAAPALGIEGRLDLRAEAVTSMVKAIDGYLLGAFLLIFAFGLYELFVSRINLAERSGFAHRVLLIQSFDDLKDRLAKVVLLILVVKFLQHALKLDYATTIDLLTLAAGILLIGGAMYLSNVKATGQR